MMALGQGDALVLSPLSHACSLLQAKDTHLYQPFLKVALYWCNLCTLSYTVFSLGDRTQGGSGGREEREGEKQTRIKQNISDVIAYESSIFILCFISAIFLICVFQVYLTERKHKKTSMHINVYTSPHIQSDMWLKAQTPCSTICNLYDQGEVLM